MSKKARKIDEWQERYSNIFNRISVREVFKLDVKEFRKSKNEYEADDKLWEIAFAYRFPQRRERVSKYLAI